jgi:hypothetical protein
LGEVAARRLRVSRSELYAKALAEYLEKQDSTTITKRLDAVYSRHRSTLNPGLDRAQLKSLPEDRW